MATDAAGYSGTPLPRKLGIKEGTAFAVRHAPDGFAATLGELPPGSEWRTQMRSPLDVVIAFYVERSRLIADWPRLTRAVSPAGTVWVAWPKRASKIDTDITEDVLRTELLPTGWVDNEVCAIDERWSGLRFALRRALRPG
jgi:hypothetical protein